MSSLRRDKLADAIRNAIASSHKDNFRVVEFSVQGNHLHTLVEAANAGALSRGMGGMATKIARRVNKLLNRRGRLFAERYHERILTTPREVRNALRYVLLNARHHEPDGGALFGSTWFDPYSSCAWFSSGWRGSIPPDKPWKRELVALPKPTADPTVWLLAVGWKKHGLLALDDFAEAR